VYQPPARRLVPAWRAASEVPICAARSRAADAFGDASYGVPGGSRSSNMVEKPGLDRHLGRLFDEVPELYDRVRPAYPDELFADLATIAGIGASSSVLEIG
jgi:hypothetical protein